MSILSQLNAISSVSEGKQCTRCGHTLPLDEFYKTKKKYFLKTTKEVKQVIIFRSYCKDCARSYEKDKYYLKKEMKCVSNANN